MRLRICGLVFALGVMACGAVRPAWAASFDCKAAHAPDEVAICTHPGLSALDSEMGGLWFAYSHVPMLMGANGNRYDEADAFLKHRAACGGNVHCLTALYRARIKTLQDELTAALNMMQPY